MIFFSVCRRKCPSSIQRSDEKGFEIWNQFEEIFAIRFCRRFERLKQKRLHYRKFLSDTNVWKKKQIFTSVFRHFNHSLRPRFLSAFYVGVGRASNYILHLRKSVRSIPSQKFGRYISPKRYFIMVF